MQNIYNYLLANFLENLGIISTLICVWLNTKENVWGWPWAIVSSFIYGIIFYREELYSDMELQIVFILISAFGWYKWLNGEKKQSLEVRDVPKKEFSILMIILIAFACISGYLHQKYTNASLPYFDSSLTAISLVAQWMLAKKYLQNWSLWIIVNIGYIAMYFSKNLYGTSVLYFLLLGLAIKGYYDWQKNAKKIHLTE
jgi:nicotinamide mononucleotide transporter